MASVPVYCLCRLPYDVTRFMIECDVCQDWFHGSCVGVEEDAAADIDLYHCPNCQLLHGPSVMKRRRGTQKQPDSGAVKEVGKAVKTGSSLFIKELRSRTFPSADEVILKPSGTQLTVEFLEENSFSVPILVLKKDGLGMTLPPPSFTVRDVEHYVGADKEIDVIDVTRQADLKMRLGDFVRYYSSSRREKVLNVISLEFSETRLSNLVETPKIVRKLSWVENLWPGESVFERPNVQKYCLMGVRDSYTDFHIDFGGTSVWYHVLRGEKIFYLVRPTAANLTLFEAWSSSSNQNELFFGDQVDRCYRCPVRQGQTLFIPTGIESLHDLHCHRVSCSSKSYEIEKRLSTADLFKFPNFETICWYVGKHLLDIFRGLRENRRHPAAYLVHGAKALNTAFRSWTRKEALAEHEEEIPGTVRPAQLIKDLAKEIRLVEVSMRSMRRKPGPFLLALRGLYFEMGSSVESSTISAHLYLFCLNKHGLCLSSCLWTFSFAAKSGAGSAVRCGWLWLMPCASFVSLPPPRSDAPASPSTQEAIQGMLCMANLQSSSSSPGASSLQAWLTAGHERGSAGASGTQRSGKRPIKRPAHHSTDSEEEASMDEQESLGTCFKDAEYIYPSLESDEDDPALKSLPKKKKCTDDAPWSPKGKNPSPVTGTGALM
uniref:PHD finger protein 8 n=1 Tax=Podarcis muralis TaxID=64176 RepID=A0A670K800_PODMU